MKLEWPNTREQLEALSWRFERRMRCEVRNCRCTIEIWRDAALPPQLHRLQEVNYSAEPAQLIPHFVRCDPIPEKTEQELKAEKRAQGADREVILRLLKSAGPGGVTNQKLNEVCLRYGARIYELRKEFEIETKPGKRGIYTFIFKGEREAQQRLFA